MSSTATVSAGQVLSTYTHVSNQLTTFGTKVIVVTRREAHHVLDEIMGNKTGPADHRARDRHAWRAAGQLRDGGRGRSA
jgi:hypothetical protein